MGFYKWIKQKRLRKRRRSKFGRKKGEKQSYKTKKDKDGKNIRR